MATIRARRSADGRLRYTAEIRLRKGKTVVYREAKTFTHRAAAEKWARSREVALENPATLSRAQYGERTLTELIRWYIDEFGTVSKWQRSKQAQLEFLEKHPTAQQDVLELMPANLIEHVRLRRSTGAGPATASNDLVWIGVVLRAAKSLARVPGDPNIVLEARQACRELRLSVRASDAIVAPLKRGGLNSTATSSAATPAQRYRCETSCGSPFIRRAAKPKSVGWNGRTTTSKPAPAW